MQMSKMINLARQQPNVNGIFVCSGGGIVFVAQPAVGAVGSAVLPRIERVCAQRTTFLTGCGCDCGCGRGRQQHTAVRLRFASASTTAAIVMASAKDTATFFQHGTASQFEHVLSLYPQALKLKAERKTKKPEELIKLDNWYQNELPKKIKSRGKDAHLIHEELVQTMKWKQTRGKFYPQLSYLVKVNTPRAVMQETKKAFKKLPNLEQAITALSNLKGVGTTMASALLAAASPENAPFMADECLMAIPEIEGIDYTTKEYLNFVQHIQAAVQRLNKGQEKATWSPHTVELALWTHFVVSEYKPDILSDIPTENGNTVHQNGDSLDPSDESNQEPLNGNSNSNSNSKSSSGGGAPTTLDEDTTTSFTEDSLDKPSTPIVANDETNDSIVSDSTNDSTAASSDTNTNNKRPHTEDDESSNSVEPTTKKSKEEEDDDK